MAQLQKIEEDEKFQRLRKRLGNLGFGYEFMANGLYAKFGGTRWKLNVADLRAIVNLAWNTPSTKVIKRTLDKRGVDVALLRTLLLWERYMKGRA